MKKKNILIKKLKIKARPRTKNKWDYFYHIYYKDKNGKQYCIDSDTLS